MDIDVWPGANIHFGLMRIFAFDITWIFHKPPGGIQEGFGP